MLARSCCALVLVLVSLAGQANQYEAEPALFMTADVWPWGYIDEKGQPAGLISELAERLGEVAGLPVENRIVPHQRLLRELRLGQVTFAVVFENPALDEFTRNLGPVLRTPFIFLGLEPNRLELSLEGLAGKRVGYIRGTYYGEAFEQDQGTRKVPVSDLEQAINMLMLGRLDAIIISEIVLRHTLDNLSLDLERFVYNVHSQGYPGNLYMFHQPRDPEQGRRIKAALDQMRDTGELDQLFGKRGRPLAR